ncbi:hypothetical protein QE152_g24672 [Popillia japonica]|uniref:Uncharacterized protein n=1 Tax=Popillia japonica TaxID=7064 RepID=A0AAW1K670_POPJA
MNSVAVIVASPPNHHVKKVMVHAPLGWASSTHKSIDIGESAAQPDTPAKRKRTSAALQQNFDISLVNASQSEHDSHTRSPITRSQGYTFTKAQNVSDDIRLFPSSEADFTGIVRFFTNDHIPFHT